MSDYYPNFYHTELRAMQIKHADNNEEFLRMAGNLLQLLTTERDELRTKVGMLEHQLRMIELGETEQEWTDHE